MLKHKVNALFDNSFDFLARKPKSVCRLANYFLVNQDQNHSYIYLFVYRYACLCVRVCITHMCVYICKAVDRKKHCREL